MQNEPVGVIAALNAAITATLAILLFVGVDPELVGALTLAAVAWIGVGAAIVRARVTPVASLGARDGGQAAIDLLVKVIVIIILVVLAIAVLRQL